MRHICSGCRCRSRKTDDDYCMWPCGLLGFVGLMPKVVMRGKMLKRHGVGRG
jgi:hypothetical protein